MLALQLMGKGVAQALSFDRTLILQGEYWRILSAHFVHISWAHLGPNLVAATLIAGIYAIPQHPRRIHFLVIDIALLGSSTGMALLWMNPSIAWFLGFSGIAHGLILTALWRCFGLHQYLLVATILVAAKLYWDIYLSMPSRTVTNSAAESTNIPAYSFDVIYEAHEYSFLGAILIIVVSGAAAHLVCAATKCFGNSSTRIISGSKTSTH